jgi:two-component system response regulator AtoC
MSKYRIFIVEDDNVYGEMLKFFLSLNEDNEVTRFSTAKDALANLGKKPDLVTLDYSLPDAKGEQVLKKIKEYDQHIAVILLSGQNDIAKAIELLKAGANDYIVKDENAKDMLWNAIARIKETQTLKREVAQLKEELHSKNDPSAMIKGSSREIQKIFGLIEKAARVNINVSVTGETGTGKELVASAIHKCGDRKNGPFVAVNMAAIPAELMESELFGHEKGAFTGAIGRKAGKFEEANKGTIFLDEIAELNLNLQSKLLRVLQEREVVRVGGSERVKLDVRIITATHRNLAEEVSKGNFREDLYYRLSGLPINLPPLRDRGNDILLLAKSFLDAFCKANRMPAMTITDDAREKLLRYHYPGNVRELKGIVELAAVMSNTSEVCADDITLQATQNMKLFTAQEKTLEQYNMEILEHYLKKYDNNVLKVAQKLDIGKSTIYRMIKSNNISLD